jgi:hypothetical protein
VGGLPILLLLACPVFVTIVAVLAVWMLRRSTSNPSERPAVTSASVNRTTWWRVAGVLVGLIVGVLTARSGGLGRGLLLAAPLFGLCVLIGVLVGEATVPAPGGTTRTAAVEVRQIRDYLPRWLSRTVAAAGVLLLLMLIVTTAVGRTDDLGRSGRVLRLPCGEGAGTIGPWPGSFYTGPLGGVLVIGLIAAYAALRLIVRRPRPGPEPAQVIADDALRRSAAETVTGALGMLFALPLAGVGLTAGGAIIGTSCSQTWTVLGSTILAVVPVALALFSWSIVAVFLPPPRARVTSA